MSPKRVVLSAGSAPVLDATAVPLEGRNALSALLAGARARGFEEGRAAARREARDDAAALLGSAAESLDAKADALTNEAARTSLELGLVIARELVLRKVLAGEHDIEGIVRSALAASGSGRGPCVIHLNPADAAALADIDFRAGTRVESDPGVRPGDVQVETPMGLMVRELDESLRDLGTRLREELR